MTTPQPPQGGNPFAQQPQAGNPYAQGGAQPQDGNPYAQGTPPQGGNPFGQQGAPQAPQPMPPGGFPPPAPPQPRSGRGKVVRKLIGVGVAIAVAVGFYLFNQSSASSSDVGDCFENTGTDIAADMKKVDCGAANAEYEVISKHEDTTDQSKCKLNAGQAAYTETVNGEPSLLLCLKSLKK